jgi:hypothetical protein
MASNHQHPPVIQFSAGEAYEKRILRLLELCSDTMLHEGLDKAVSAEDYEAAILFRDELERRGSKISLP